MPHHAPARKLPALFAFIICLAAALPAMAQESADAALRRAHTIFTQAFQDKDWPRAIEFGHKLIDLDPDQHIYQYNLACAYSLSGDIDNAAKWLGRSAETGFDQPELFETDSDLNNVRGHRGYEAALTVIKQTLQRQMDEIDELFKKNPPLIITPPRHKKTKPAPVIISMHGYGGRAEGYPVYWRKVARQVDAVLVIPRAVRPLPNDGPGASWNNPDEADRLVDLTLKYAAEKIAIDEDRIILSGFSQGAFMAQTIGLRHPQKFLGIIPMAGGYVPNIDAPQKAKGKRIPRFYFMVGEEDRNADQVKLAAKDFKAAGYPTKLRIYPDVAHRYPKDNDKELRKALKFILDD